MAVHALRPNQTEASFLENYLTNLSLIERLHRLLLDVIKDEFERLQIGNINAVQALLVYNIGEQEVSAGELRTRGYYQGSNVSYNLKKLVEADYIHHKRCSVDRRSVKIKLTEKGFEIRDIVGVLFANQARLIGKKPRLSEQDLTETNKILASIEKFWAQQIRYIY